MLRSAIILLAVALASCVYRPVPGRSDITTADAEFLECERINPTGTRLGKVVCLTPEEKERMAAEGREQLERMQQSARGATKDPP